MIECYILQNQASTTLYDDQVGLLSSQYSWKDLAVYPCSKVQKLLSILYSFPVMFSNKNLIVDQQFGYSKDILMNGKSIIHVLSFHPLPYYSN